ncbi:putative protein TPRXL [Homarus americanus]|uniref:putative protein TPRXL n=1 Tax=Homarus americanus TaxID=6706 RepID=UPI001C45C4BE|nr:putative protein TPRXL [Homarus americanus]
MTSGMERKLNAGKAGKSGKGSEGQFQQTRSSGHSLVLNIKETRKHTHTTQSCGVSQRGDGPRKTEKTTNIPPTKDKGRREKANKVKEKTKVKQRTNSPQKVHKTNEHKSNSPSRSPVREPPDKSDTERDTSESESVSNNSKEVSVASSPSRRRQQLRHPSKDDKQESSSSSTKTTALPASSEPLALTRTSNLRDPKPPKEPEKDQKDPSEMGQYPRDALLSRWIECRSGKFGGSSQSLSSGQSRPLMSHKLKPSPFQNLMAAQELLKNQKDSERADKINTEASSDSSDSSGATQKKTKRW